eukprot:GHVT01068773.1.p1 GENE.GHVT01068773.1~~GHVT01068773.1.p1  ORF type:complete len:109 (-),score=18.17 GHVT01068773.1:1186-1512(-)
MFKLKQILRCRVLPPWLFIGPPLEIYKGDLQIRRMLPKIVAVAQLDLRPTTTTTLLLLVCCYYYYATTTSMLLLLLLRCYYYYYSYYAATTIATSLLSSIFFVHVTAV